MDDVHFADEHLFIHMLLYIVHTHTYTHMRALIMPVVVRLIIIMIVYG